MLEKLIELMKLYSRRGLADWKETPYPLRKSARRHLTHAGIAENEAQANIAINTIWNQNNTSCVKFIPMPKRSRNAFERCLFLPIREITANGCQSMGFELFVLVDETNCLAFRYETAHPGSIHNYGHVQLTKVLKKRAAPTTIPSWIPDSFPAFPIGTSDPLEVFLAMAVSVHGYQGGFLDVLREAFQEASRPRNIGFYVERLRDMLN